MKKILISRLRNKETTQTDFRKAAEELSDWLAFEAASLLPKKEVSVETPVGPTVGQKFLNDQVVIPILRAGLSMLPSFLRVLPEAKVGFLGMRRDEHTFQAKLYYENLPLITPSTDVLILDPMIATGGSGKVALDRLKEQGADPFRILYVGIIASREGLSFLKSIAPQMKVVVGDVDDKLNDKKFIVPGLGDFGDRYFGTVT